MFNLFHSHGKKHPVPIEIGIVKKLDSQYAPFNLLKINDGGDRYYIKDLTSSKWEIGKSYMFIIAPGRGVLKPNGGVHHFCSCVPDYKLKFVNQDSMTGIFMPENNGKFGCVPKLYISQDPGNNKYFIESQSSGGDYYSYMPVILHQPSSILFASYKFPNFGALSLWNQKINNIMTNQNGDENKFEASVDDEVVLNGGSYTFSKSRLYYDGLPA